MPQVADKIKTSTVYDTPYTYLPTEKEKFVVADVYPKFRDSQMLRDQNFEYFDGRNLINYIDDSVKRFVTNEDEREDIEDWQARENYPFTRNKMMAILSKAAASLPTVEFFSSGTEDLRRSQLLGDLYKQADQLDDTDELMFYALLEAGVKGTVIGYEGYEEKIKDIREIVDYDDGEGVTVKDGKKITRRVYGAIVPLEGFYPSSPGIKKIKDMPYAFWRSRMPESEFKLKLGHYPKAVNVRPYSTYNGEHGNRPFYLDYISNDVAEGHVEVLRYYNQDTDEFVICANGIWLNPMTEKTTEVVMPIPFAHKSLPFWKAIYEPFGADFFYGKSLPDKLKAMQDVINVLHNMMLDQAFLTIFPPLLIAGQDDIEDDYLRPGRRIPVDDPNNFKELAMSTPGNFHQFILQYTKRVLEESSLDAVNQGVAGSGERVTATEINRAAQGVASIIGLFHSFIRWAVKDKDRLRIKNIMQFYTAPLLEQILGEGGSEEVKKAFNIFKIEDTTLSSGKLGVKIIEMFRSREALPAQTELKAQARLQEIETGKKIEKVAITPEYIRNFEFDIKIVPNTSTEMSKALQRALVLIP